MRFSKLRKLAIILIVCFCIKVLLSCTIQAINIQISYNKISLKGLDNGYDFYGQYYTDKLLAGAVAISLTLSDSDNYRAYNSKKTIDMFSFTSAYATSQMVNYVPTTKVIDIEVTTVFDIDDTFKAGDNISSSIFYAIDRFTLYNYKSEVINKMNGYQDKDSVSTIMILKSYVENTKAKFIVNISLDDGSVLTQTTNEFSIISTRK